MSKSFNGLDIAEDTPVVRRGSARGWFDGSFRDLAAFVDAVRLSGVPINARVWFPERDIDGHRTIVASYDADQYVKEEA